MKLSVEEKVQGSKTKALYQLPFLGLPMSKLKFIRDDKIRTACTDGIQVRWSGIFFETLTKLEITFVNLHEVFHVILKHHLNTPKHYDFKVANMAQDYVINLMLKVLADKYPKLLSMPESALYDERFKDMSWQQVYSILIKEQPPKQSNQDAPQQGGGNGEEDQQDGDDDADDGEGSGADGDDGADEGDGNSAGGSSEDDQSSDGFQQEDVGGCGTWTEPMNEDGSPMSQADKDNAEAEIDVMIEQAQNLARSKGGVEAELMGIIEDLKAPKVNWRNQLRKFFAPVVTSGYHFRGFNRSMRPMGIKLPTSAKNGVGEILLNIDTSGSIVDRVDDFMAEFKDIVTKVKPKKVTVQYFHHEVWRTEEMDLGRNFQLPPEIKSGGTCFEEPMKIVQDKKRKKPRVIVWLTDLYAPFPEDPKIPTLWVTTEDNQAPWGKTIKLDEKATQ